MFGWFKRQPCECRYPDPDAHPVREEAERPVAVPLCSPAYALEQSLTSPETRDEWVREYRGLGGAGFTEYRNKAREIWISITISAFSNYMTTPFTLNREEEKIMKRALAVWNEHRRRVTEMEALARLTSKATAITEENPQ